MFWLMAVSAYCYTLFEISAKEIGMIRDLDFDGQHMQSMGLINIHGSTAQKKNLKECNWMFVMEILCKMSVWKNV